MKTNLAELPIYPRCTITDVYAGNKICDNALYSDERTACCAEPCKVRDLDCFKGIFWSIVAAGCTVIFGLFLSAVIFEI
jgi:hypothetical protein